MRKLRKHVEGQVVYIHASSAAGMDIFADDEHCLFFIEKTAMLAQELNYKIYLLCILPQTIHLVMLTSAYSISRFMHRLQTAYAVYFNRRNSTSGHVFARRFSDRRVLSDRALLQLSRYIHLSPGFPFDHSEMSQNDKIKRIRTYPWSSARGYLGVGARHNFISYSRILTLFDSNPLTATDRYRNFLEGPLIHKRTNLLGFIENPSLCLRDVESDSGQGASEKTISCEQAVHFALKHFSLKPKSLKSPQYYVHERAWTGIILTEKCGLTQLEAAKILGWNSNAALSIQMRNLRAKAQKDMKLSYWLNNNNKAFSDFVEKEIR